MIDLMKVSRAVTEHTGLPASSVEHARVMGRALADLTAPAGTAHLTGMHGERVILAREYFQREEVGA